MDVRTCRNGHTLPVVTYKGSMKLRCVQCERDRSNRRLADPVVRDRKNRENRERRMRVKAGW